MPRALGASSVRSTIVLQNTDLPWGTPAKLLHWLVAAFVLVQIALGWAAVGWQLSPTKLDLIVWHKSTGMLILVLMVVRVAWRSADNAPALPTGIRPLERRAARAKRQLMRALLLTTTPLVVSAHSAQAADWTMDAGSSRLEFAVTFEKSVAPGIFREFDTRMRFDADKIAESRLDVTIATSSADMNIAPANKAISGAEWFDFVRFPQAEFHATDVSRTAAGRYLARGVLSLKGVQQPVEVPFTWTETVDAARMEGELVVKRSAFGIGTGAWAATNVIGADVKIKFSVRLRKRG